MDLEFMTDRKGEDCETPVARRYSHEEKARMGIKEIRIMNGCAFWGPRETCPDDGCRAWHNFEMCPVAGCPMQETFEVMK